MASAFEVKVGSTNSDEAAVVGIFLSLTTAEAAALYTVCQVVGGKPSKTRRRFIDNVRRALQRLDSVTILASDEHINGEGVVLGGSVRHNVQSRGQPAPTSPHPIPYKPCFSCGLRTSETQSVYGVGHRACYLKAVRNAASVNL